MAFFNVWYHSSTTYAVAVKHLNHGTGCDYCTTISLYHRINQATGTGTTPPPPPTPSSSSPSPPALPSQVSHNPPSSSVLLLRPRQAQHPPLTHPLYRYHITNITLSNTGITIQYPTTHHHPIPSHHPTHTILYPPPKLHPDSSSARAKHNRPFPSGHRIMISRHPTPSTPPQPLHRC